MAFFVAFFYKKNLLSKNILNMLIDNIYPYRYKGEKKSEEDNR